jgi:hypothetical protein
MLAEAANRSDLPKWQLLIDSRTEAESPLPAQGSLLADRSSQFDSAAGDSRTIWDTEMRLYNLQLPTYRGRYVVVGQMISIFS